MDEEELEQWRKDVAAVKAQYIPPWEDVLVEPEPAREYLEPSTKQDAMLLLSPGFKEWFARVEPAINIMCRLESINKKSISLAWYKEYLTEQEEKNRKEGR